MEMASFSSNEKVKLIQNLKEIRATNYTMQFCNLLIEAQKLLNLSNKDSLKHIETIFCGLKKIINPGLADVLVEKLFEILLYDTNEKSDKEKQYLLKLLSKSECKGKSDEYLKQLIKYMESLVKLFSNTDLYFYYSNLIMEDPNRDLIILKCFVMKYGSDKAEELLRSMFIIRMDKFSFSCKEEEEIRGLMIEAIPFIEKRIEHSCNDFQDGLSLVNLQRRSSLQFIKDVLANSPAGNENSGELIGKLDKIAEVLDDFFGYWCDLMKNDVSDEEYSDEDFNLYHYVENLESFNKAGGCIVPNEHIWWQKYKDTLIK